MLSNTDLSFHAPVGDRQKNHVSVWQLERSTLPDGSAIGDRDFGFIPDWEPALLTELEHVGDVTDLVVSDCVLLTELEHVGDVTDLVVSASLVD